MKLPLRFLCSLLFIPALVVSAAPVEQITLDISKAHQDQSLTWLQGHARELECLIRHKDGTPYRDLKGWTGYFQYGASATAAAFAVISSTNFNRGQGSVTFSFTEANLNTNGTWVALVSLQDASSNDYWAGTIDLVIEETTVSGVSSLVLQSVTDASSLTNLAFTNLNFGGTTGFSDFSDDGGSTTGLAAVVAIPTGGTTFTNDDLTVSNANAVLTLQALNNTAVENSALKLSGTRSAPATFPGSANPAGFIRGLNWSTNLNSGTQYSLGEMWYAVDTDGAGAIGFRPYADPTTGYNYLDGRHMIWIDQVYQGAASAINARLRLPTGLASRPTICSTLDTDTGIYFLSPSNIVSVGVAGSEVARFDSSGAAVSGDADVTGTLTAGSGAVTINTSGVSIDTNDLFTGASGALSVVPLFLAGGVTSPVIRSATDLRVVLDADADSTSTLSVWNHGGILGSGLTEVLTLDESGNLAVDGNLTFGGSLIGTETMSLSVSQIVATTSATITNLTVATSLSIPADSIDSADYAADSIDNEHINWADIDYLGDEGKPADLIDSQNYTTYRVTGSDAGADLSIKIGGDSNYIELDEDGDIMVGTKAHITNGLAVLGGTVTLPADSVQGTAIDWADATDLEGAGELSDDTVAAAEMADADHGDIAWSSGVASVENVPKTATVKIYTEHLGTAHTLTASECYGSVYYVTNPVTITLPAVADGMNFSVISTTGATVVVDANASDCIVLDGTYLDDGDSIDSGGSAGDMVVFTYFSATGLAAQSDGWSDGGAS